VAKYVEGWPSTTSAWLAGADLDRYGGVRSLLIYTSTTLGSPTCHQASQQENMYLLSKISKSGQGQHSVYSVAITRGPEIYSYEQCNMGTYLHLRANISKTTGKEACTAFSTPTELNFVRKKLEAGSRSTALDKTGQRRPIYFLKRSRSCCLPRSDLVLIRIIPLRRVGPTEVTVVPTFQFFVHRNRTCPG
jgi:hypothetical protein